jgi:hypothetical protein
MTHYAAQRQTGAADTPANRHPLISSIHWVALYIAWNFLANFLF